VVLEQILDYPFFENIKVKDKETVFSIEKWFSTW